MDFINLLEKYLPNYSTSQLVTEFDVLQRYLDDEEVSEDDLERVLDIWDKVAIARYQQEVTETLAVNVMEIILENRLHSVTE